MEAYVPETSPDYRWMLFDELEFDNNILTQISC